VVVGPPGVGTEGGTNEHPATVATTSAAPIVNVQILRIAVPRTSDSGSET
jgi:hypothetical protein